MAQARPAASSRTLQQASLVIIAFLIPGIYAFAPRTPSVTKFARQRTLHHHHSFKLHEGRATVTAIASSTGASNEGINSNKSRIRKLISAINPVKSDTARAIRGDGYGPEHNSTILPPADAADAVGVKPTLEASKEEWQRAWKIHRRAMRALHLFDGCQPKDSKLAL